MMQLCYLQVLSSSHQSLKSLYRCVCLCFKANISITLFQKSPTYSKWVVYGMRCANLGTIRWINRYNKIKIKKESDPIQEVLFQCCSMQNLNFILNLPVLWRYLKIRLYLSYILEKYKQQLMQMILVTVHHIWTAKNIRGEPYLLLTF